MKQRLLLISNIIKPPLFNSYKINAHILKASIDHFLSYGHFFVPDLPDNRGSDVLNCIRSYPKK